MRVCVCVPVRVAALPCHGCQGYLLHELCGRVGHGYQAGHVTLVDHTVYHLKAEIIYVNYVTYVIYRKRE